MDLVSFNEIGSTEWDSFCLESDSAWFRHTSIWLDFCVNLNSENENLSFGIMEKGKILAVVPLIRTPIEGEAGLFEFAMAGTSVPYPALANGLSELKSSKIIKSIFEKFDEMAEDLSVARSRVFIDPLSKSFLSGLCVYNPFLKMGFNEVSLTTNIIDLSGSNDELFANIRDGYKYDIKTAVKKSFVVDFFDKDSLTAELFQKYKEIYFSSAGSEVGTKKRWENTYNLIRSGYAFLALEKGPDEEYISGIIVFVYKKQSYYAFGATHADFKDQNGISHLLQWEVIKFLKAKNFEYYELGWNFYPIISDDVYPPKQLSISFFKAGFGAEIHPLFRGEKFFMSEYLKKRKSSLVEKFVESGYMKGCK